ISGGVTCTIDTRASPHAVNNTVPAGGDTCAIAMLITKTIAKCVGSMPNWIAMGRKIGTVIRMVGVGSRNVPMANKKRFISRNTVKALFVLFRRYDENVSGTRSRVITQLNANDVKIRNITSPVITVVWTADASNPFQSNSRYTKAPMKAAYTTATAPASVGVKTPPTIPETMIAGVTPGTM